MPITKKYIINLKRRPDKLIHCQNEIQKTKFLDNYEVFEGIEPTDKGDFSSIGNHGCYLSHMACLERASQNKDMTLVMEDDFVLCDNFDALVKPYIDQLENNIDWDIFQFYNYSNTEFSYRILKNKPPNPAYFYLISGFNAQRTYNIMKSYSAIPFDVRLMFLCKQEKKHIEVWSAGEQLVKVNSALGTDLRKKPLKPDGHLVI